MTAATGPRPGAAPRTPEELVRGLVHGRWRGEVLHAFLELGLPERLDGRARTLAPLAAELGVDRDGLGRLLAAAAALGLCAADGAGYRATPATVLLREDHPLGMRTEARHALSPWSRIAWDHLEYAVRHGTSGFAHATGMPVFGYLAGRPGQAAVFQEFQARVTGRNSTALLAAYQLPATGTVIDVGGGTGALLGAILRREPGLHGVVYDLPEVVGGAVAPADLGDRLDFRGGDFFAAVPPGARLYLLSHVLHDWPDRDAGRILARVRAAMDAGSELLVLENARPEGDGNLLVNYLDVLMLAAWGGRERTVVEYRRLLEGAGLGPVTAHPLDERAGLTALVAAA